METLQSDLLERESAETERLKNILDKHNMVQKKGTAEDWGSCKAAC